MGVVIFGTMRAPLEVLRAGWAWWSGAIEGSHSPWSMWTGLRLTKEMLLQPGCKSRWGAWRKSLRSRRETGGTPMREAEIAL